MLALLRAEEEVAQLRVEVERLKAENGKLERVAEAAKEAHDLGYVVTIALRKALVALEGEE